MKRILSILLTALMVLTIIPVSVFMASAETVTFADKTLAAGESTTETIDLTKVDRTQPLTITMDVKAANATSTANGKDAVLKIGGVRTIRITGGAGIIITGYQSFFQQWNNANGTNNFVITIDFAAATISFVGANRSLTVALSEIGIDVSGDSLVLQFGDADTGACSFKNISVAYTAVATEEPDQPDQPGDDVIPTDLFSTGEKSYGGWVDASVDTYTVTANGTSGDITVVMVTGNTNWQGKAKILTINGKTVFYGNGRSGQPAYSLGDDAAVYDTWDGRTITVVINPTTGDATVSDGVGNSATTNVGVIGNTFNVVVGQPNTNSWKLTSLTVTQAIGAVADTQSRETYNYYYNDFTTEKSNSGLVGQYTNKGSSVVDGALCVNPAEVNQWGNANAVFPSGVVFKFDFMLPVLPTGDEVVKLLFDRTVSDYFILVTESGVKMNGGNPVNTVAIEANKYYTVTIVMADTGSVVYVDGTLVGTTAKTFTGRTAGWGLFNFNHQANANTLTYYIDNIAATDVADETFVKVVGYQKTNVDNGTYCVRFTTAVFDLYAGEECIGFDIEAPAFGKSWNKTTTTVYTSLTANYGTEEVLASDEGAKYITAMALTGLPASEGTIELVITPYVVINGIKVCGTAVTLTVNPVQ